MEVLVAGTLGAGSHEFHPEVVGVGAEGMEGLFEADFDLEAVTVELNDGEWLEGEVGRHEDDAATGGMVDEDEAHEVTDGPPEQIDGEVA